MQTEVISLMKDNLRMIPIVWKMFLLFIILTTVFYVGITWIDQHLSHVQRYEDPGNGAIQVVQYQEEARKENSGKSISPSMRLLEFLRDGE